MRLLLVALLGLHCAGAPPRARAQVCREIARWTEISQHGDTTEIAYFWRCDEARH